MVYANFDDGMFEVGCTYEHAGYFLSWLCSFFGPVKRMQSFAATCIRDKGIPVEEMAPDFTVGCLEFGEEIVARVTCGLVAPMDKSITVIGDEGILEVENLRDDYGSVRYQPRVAGPVRACLQQWLRGAQRRLPGFFPSSLRNPITLRTHRKLPMPAGLPRLPVAGEKRVDFLRGPAEMVAAIREGRPSRLPGELGAHIVEIIQHLQYPEAHSVALASSCPCLKPVGINDEN
jgi:predicted dehydrogenase